MDNSSVWFGVNKDASVTQSSINLGIIPTSCNRNGSCTASPFEIADDWLKLFLLKNASADLGIMNHEEFDRLAQISRQMYDSIIGTNDPDLSNFKSRGGKLVGYHGVVSSHWTLLHLYMLIFARPTASYQPKAACITTTLSQVWTRMCTTSTDSSFHRA